MEIWHRKSRIGKDNYLIVIVDSIGFKELKAYVGNNKIVPIFITAPQEEIKARALARGDLEAEVDRRLKMIMNVLCLLEFILYIVK